jgi:S1-C subfamily serine protease
MRPVRPARTLRLPSPNLLDQSRLVNHFRCVTKRLIHLALVLLLAAAPARSHGAEPEKSVVQINTFSQQPAWEAPWRFDSVRRSGGTGFVIRGKRIMTNAHVISWAKQILVKRYQDPKPYIARVAYIGHDCDLALLEVDDPAFFEGMEPLVFGDLPKVRSTVITYGYPAGGEQISYTRGVVSRIEMQTYVHSGNRTFLSVQTDAAINPGNSGGPVIQDDYVVGVAFQGTPGLENTGFFIPPPIIQHFLTDVADNKYDGFPTAGIRVMPLQNPAYRRALKIPDNNLGARIDSLLAIPSTQKVLKPDDVLLRVGTFEVGSDGSILYQGNRVNLAAALQGAQNGESVPLTLWREGKELAVSLPVFVNQADRSSGNQYDSLPRYYVHAGLVFTPLSLDYLKTFGRNWSDSASSELVYDLYYRRHESPENTRPEPIVLASVLAAPVNANVGVRGRLIVDKINGIRIEKLEDVIRAIESHQGAEHIIEFFPKDTLECIDRAEAEQSNAKIMQTYGIPKDRRL